MEITNVTSHALDKGDIANTLNPVFLLLFIIVFCFGLCLTFNVPMSYLTRLALFAILTYGVQFGFSQLSGDLIGTFVAAIVAGVLSNIYTKSPSQPPRVVLFISSFFILTVGSMGIEGLSSIIGGYVVEGTREVISMIILFPTVTIGIAIGYLISTQKKQMQQKKLKIRCYQSWNDYIMKIVPQNKIRGENFRNEKSHRDITSWLHSTFSSMRK
ncbi:hypothetical protein PROCOU_15909 [Listeria rocourtiae FSL F6-920]|nr:hypothetical protein PROCOU_15909 [Listeria rocourtiae FSL F6-920]